MPSGEARLRVLDMPTKVAMIDPDGGIPVETIRRAVTGTALSGRVPSPIPKGLWSHRATGSTLGLRR